MASGIYYYQPVLWAVENGITSGTSATTFAPDNPCTRAQVVTFLYRALKDQ
ncbi:MAG: S-layer homology domain-containing protein [Oscillospiraceae bacterium]|nr:S-layer homology domain-containing protein [Oscillospiraceae bacterium]